MSADIEYNLSVNVDNARSELRAVLAQTAQVMSLVARFTGDDNLKAGINTMLRGIAVTQNLIRVIKLADLAISTSLGPIGWLKLGVGTAVTVASGYSLYESLVGTGAGV